MKNKGKHIAIIAMIVCLALCFGVAACDGDKGPETETATYTVTVQTAADAPAAGVKVTVKKGAASFDPKTTDSNGKATFELVPDEYDVTLSDLPAHYGVPSDANLKLTAEDHDLTVTLAKNFAYVVKLQNPDGSPYYAENVQVGVCVVDGNCLQPVDLGSNGIAEIEVAKANYHVHILGLPASAAYECDGDGYYTGEDFSETKTEMTITIYPATAVDFSATPMTAAEKDAYKTDKNPNFDTNFTAHKMTVGSLAKDEFKHIAIRPSVSGKYMLYSADGASYLFQDTEFKNEHAGKFLYTSVTLEKDKTYYFSVENTGNDPINTEFVVTSPAASYIETSGVGGTVNLTILQDKANAVVAFTPTKAAKYTATVKGDAHAKITVSKGREPDLFVTGDIDPSEYGANATCSTKLTNYEMSRAINVLYFAVSLTDVTSYPVSVEVEIVKGADIADTTTVMTVSETLTQYTKPADKTLMPVPMSESTVLVKGNDNFYHLGTADGPVVVVSLTKPIDASRFGEAAALCYIDKTNSRLATYVLDVTSDADLANLEKGYTFHDYREFLRGFKDYDEGEMTMQGPTLEIPETLTQQNCYANYVDAADGTYPLTEELKTFLEEFYNVNSSSLMWQIPECDEGCEWMFPLYYYDEVEIDPIVGEYTGTANDMNYRLTVTATGTFVLTELSDMGNYDMETGTWSKTDSTYTFVCDGAENFGSVLTYTDGTFRFTDNMGSDITLTVPADPIVGNYAGTGSDGENYTLTVSADGTYEVFTASGESNETGTWTKDADADTYTFVCPTWSVTYTVYVNEGALEFFDDPDSFEPYYTFAPASGAPVNTLLTADEDAKLEFYADGTFTLSAFNPRGGWMTLASGEYSEGRTGITLDFTDTSSIPDTTLTSSHDINANTLTVTMQDADPDITDTVFVFDTSEYTPAN